MDVTLFLFAFFVSFIILANEIHAFVGGDGHHHFRRSPSGWLGAGPLPVGPEIRRFRPAEGKARGASKSFK